MIAVLIWLIVSLLLVEILLNLNGMYRLKSYPRLWFIIFNSDKLVYVGSTINNSYHYFYTDEYKGILLIKFDIDNTARINLYDEDSENDNFYCTMSCPTIHNILFYYTHKVIMKRISNLDIVKGGVGFLYDLKSNEEVNRLYRVQTRLRKINLVR
jgi:hypothetical protein